MCTFMCVLCIDHMYSNKSTQNIQYIYIVDYTFWYQTENLIIILNSDYEILHQREVKDLKAAHSMDRSSLEQRDLQNSQEIETLHRKCRCLTKL